MSRWKLSVGLAAVTLIAAALAPRLLPRAADEPATMPEVAELTEVIPEVVPAPPVDPGAPRHIDVVLAIDTSGSMDDLLDSTRARLWDIVNGIDARDPEAELRVGLIAFGSPAYGHENGFVKVVSPLTTDLDAVYAAAFGLTIDGGDEFVGQALQQATRGLDWTPTDDPDDRRLLFVAGNESANQGPVDALHAVGTARRQGILVSTLFAGAHDAGQDLGWESVARLGGGRYLAIEAADSARGVVQTPYDDRLQELNQAINDTYLAYGATGRAKLDRMNANDARARSMGSGALSSRIAAKGSSKFKTASWDLVSAAEDQTVDLADLKDDALPEVLQGLDAATRKAKVGELAAQRREAQSEIQELQKQRATFLQQAAPAEDEGLDTQMDQAIADLL